MFRNLYIFKNLLKSAFGLVLIHSQLTATMTGKTRETPLQPRLSRRETSRGTCASKATWAWLSRSGSYQSEFKQPWCGESDWNYRISSLIAATSFFFFLPNSLGNAWIKCCFQHLVSTTFAEPCFSTSQGYKVILHRSLGVMVIFLSVKNYLEMATLQCSKLILGNDIFSPNTRNVSTWNSVMPRILVQFGEQKKWHEFGRNMYFLVSSRNQVIHNIWGQFNWS